MTRWFRHLLVVVPIQLYAVHCDAASSTDLTLSACNYSSENLYVVTSDVQELFPTGYTQCTNATGPDAKLCELCTCREKKVATVAEVAVAWVVCVGSGNPTTCTSTDGSKYEFCTDRNSSGSFDDDVNVGDSSSSTSSEIAITNGSDASAGVSSSSSSSDASVDIGSSSFDTIMSSVGSNSDSSPTATPSATKAVNLTLLPGGSGSQATNEDNVITGDLGTVETSQTSVPSSDQNIVRPSDGSTNEFDTNNGNSTTDWSRTRLVAVGTVISGVTAVAAIAVFVAIRNYQARKRKTLGTPADEYTDDDSSLATPMTHRLDGGYRHTRRYGNNSDNTPLASIVVIGPDDDYQTPTAYASTHQHRSYSRTLSDSYARTESANARGDSVRLAIPAAQQFDTSHGPPVSELPLPTHDPIFDSNNTQVSFSSSMSSEYESAPPPSGQTYESEGNLADSTYTVGSQRDSDVSTEPRKRETSLPMEEQDDEKSSNTIARFSSSSLSSLNSAEYDIRDTNVSKRMHPSELTSSRVAACDYSSENLYVVNTSDPQELFPAGYVQCANATEPDVTLCEHCTCRKKKVASVAGVTVAWVVCVGSGDPTTCTSTDGSKYEFCTDRNSSGSFDDDVNVGDSSSSTSSEIAITNGSDASAGVSSSSSSSDASVDVGSSSSFDTIMSSVGSNSDPSPTATPSATAAVSLTLLPDGSNSHATNEDNVITGDLGTVEPSQISAPSTGQNIVRPSDGSTHELDTNNGSSTNSDWSGTRLVAVGTVMCGVAVIAAIAVFVAIRKDQARKKKALGTPVDEYTDDDSSIATPMTHRLDGGYRHNRRRGNSSLSDNTPLASIVVIGPDDDFQTPAAYASTHQYRSYSRKLSDGYARTESAKASASSARLNTAKAVPAERQFDSSHGPPVSELPSPTHDPPVSELPSPTHDPIFDTNNTQVSFSSSMSSEYESAPPPSERICESEGSLEDSFRMVSSTYSVGSLRESNLSTEPRRRETSLLMEEEDDDEFVSNTIASFSSSLSSLNSAEYDIRDTDASEHIYPSELGTTSSRIALSFDVGSVSPRD
ncbi:hypothetical protein P3T76_015322 [Phytophthora citrophthora]|uniref:Uncharacterized protein n=1 Tax=Phytophthora citrophthora TaxID=4793 RepID=A0AAD9FZK1_9STRA|nr:hypothetical protein P3T76_015322 [Phytophthora citrophthora]